MKYDDASWHYGGDFPEGFPEENGGIHIALYLKWAFMKGWAGDIHLSEAREETERVISSKDSATKFFYKYCDGKLTDEDFNDEGESVTNRYYGKDGYYLNDYNDYIGDRLYRISEDEHNLEKLFSIMDYRFESGLLTKNELRKRKKAVEKQRNKPTWKFW